MSSSIYKTNKLLSPLKKAHRVIAAIKAMGFSKPIVLGSSSGGIIAFQVAIDYPDTADIPVKCQRILCCRMGRRYKIL
jgi:pimeloyl-ACP methyl ester carboxylesterase